MSTSVVDSRANFYGGDDFDWKNYEEHRPIYPQKLYDVLFEYHAKSGSHPAQWDLAADFGTGVGTIISGLLQRFKKVVGSDLNEAQIEIARKRLIVEHGADRVELHIGAAEKCDWVKDGMADLVIAATAIHWFDNQAWIEQAARLLKPGGTLAFWIYTPMQVIKAQNDEACGLSRKLNELNFSFLSQEFPVSAIAPILSHLKSIAVDENLFELEERHYWLLEGDDAEGDVSHLKVVKERTGPIVNRVGKDAKEIYHDPEPDEGQCGKDGKGYLLERGPWTLENVRLARKSLGNRDTSYMDNAEIVKLQQDLVTAIGGPTGTFYVGTPLFLVMAKRK